MKKSLLALAALTAFAGAASAQSSVTLSGRVDLNVRNIKNDAARTGMGQDGIGSSNLTFRGVEDMGGGMRAGFWLEAGVNADMGTANASFFNRRSTVSVIGSFGEIRLGRDYTPDFWNHTVYDPFGTNGVGSSVNVFAPGGTAIGSNGATTTVRANNSVGYFLPSMGGFGGQVMLAAGEGAVGNKHTAGRLTYAAGPLSLGVAYGKTEATSSADWTRFNLGGSYKMGFATLMAQYNQGKSSGGTNAGQKQTSWLLGAVAPMGAHTLKASYTDSNGSGAGADTRDATQIALGYQYDLSKRTALYGNYSRIANDAGANFRVGTVGDATTHGLTSDRNSTGFEIGIRHNF